MGIDHDTAQFDVQSMGSWWNQMGRVTYPDATELLITADACGSNGYRTRLWKPELQRLADESGLTVSVCHLPPGTSKWNRIEHRMFCHISQNWRGRPLLSLEAVVDLIANTQTTKGLTIESAPDQGTYDKGISISDGDMAGLCISPDVFHREWNYAIRPRKTDVKLRHMLLNDESSAVSMGCASSQVCEISPVSLARRDLTVIPMASGDTPKR